MTTKNVLIVLDSTWYRSQKYRFRTNYRDYHDVIMSSLAAQITSLTIVYSTVYSGADQEKHQCPASLAFVRGIHRWPVNSPHKGPVTRTFFPFDDVIMIKHHINGRLFIGTSLVHSVWALLKLCLFIAPLVIHLFANVLLHFFQTRSYLTGVTAAELRRHLPNMDVTFNR